MKHLIIRNVGPVRQADLSLKRVNMIIGPQSSGKSTVLKVAAFCSWMERQIQLTQNPQRFCDYDTFVNNLVNFNKLQGYLGSDSWISYENDSIAFTFSVAERRCSFRWIESQRWHYRRSKIAYIPSDRNLVATISNWYQISMPNDLMLNFMKEWEFARKAFAGGIKILDLPVEYRYNADSQSDSVLLETGRELDLTLASSGVRSLTPMFILLHYFTNEYFGKSVTSVEHEMLTARLAEVVARECSGMSSEQQRLVVEYFMQAQYADLYIEEPEAHIFPSTQLQLVYTLAEMLNSPRRHSCFISTHSPYILTAFNNLLYAAEIAGCEPHNAAKVAEIIPTCRQISANEVAAFEISNGTVKSIIDEEYQLISADAIDNASQRIAEDFDRIQSI